MGPSAAEAAEVQLQSRVPPCDGRDSVGVGGLRGCLRTAAAPIVKGREDFGRQGPGRRRRACLIDARFIGRRGHRWGDRNDCV